MNKPLTKREMNAVEEFVKDMQKLFNNSIELEHFTNVIREIYLLRQNAKYEAKHIEALWDDNENLRGVCKSAMEVISGLASKEACGLVMKKLEDALSAGGSISPEVCDHCGQQEEVT